MAEIADVVLATNIEVSWGNAIRDRTVQRYPTAAGRASEHPSPAAGDVSFLEDSGTLELFHGGSWRGIIPAGMLAPYGGATAPAGWLLCQGQLVSRTTYAGLYAAIGSAYGNGDGVTTFGVPDLRQRLPLGKAASGVGDTLGVSGGAVAHTHAGPSHAHANPWTSLQNNHQHSGSSGTTAQGGHQHTNPNTASGGSHAHAAGSTGAASGGTAGSGVSSPLVSQTGHTHDAPTTATDGSHAHAQGDTGAVGDHAHGVNLSDGAGAHQHTIADTTAGGTGATGPGDLPPYVVVNYIIKT